MARDELRKRADAIIADLRGGGSSGTPSAQIVKSPKGNLVSFFKLQKGEQERTSAQLDGI